MRPCSTRGPAGQFSKGVSGNPGGRPRRLRDLDAAIATTHDAARVLKVLDKLSELALAGDVQAAKTYLDRVVGPVRSDDDERRIEQGVYERLEYLLAEARARRDGMTIAREEGSTDLSGTDDDEPTSGGATPPA